MGSHLQALGTTMTNFLSILWVSVAVVLLCFSSRPSEGSGPVLSRLESKINQLEEKYNSLSGQTCEDGKSGKDGDCENICSKDHFLTYENTTARFGRMACCRKGEVVAPSGACQKEGVPDFCYKLKARLVNTKRFGQRIFLRGSEGEIAGGMFRCDNDCCCSGGLLDSENLSRNALLCDIRVELTKRVWNGDLGLRDSCGVISISNGNKFNFSLANPVPYYRVN